MWISKDKDGTIIIWKEKPFREGKPEPWCFAGIRGMILNEQPSVYNIHHKWLELTWESSPKKIIGLITIEQ